MCIGLATDVVEAAKNGANLVLHHLGPSTLAEITEVERECQASGAKTTIVGGDISDPNTAQAVSCRSMPLFPFPIIPCHLPFPASSRSNSIPWSDQY